MQNGQVSSLMHFRHYPIHMGVVLYLKDNGKDLLKLKYFHLVKKWSWRFCLISLLPETYQLQMPQLLPSLLVTVNRYLLKKSILFDTLYVKSLTSEASTCLGEFITGLSLVSQCKIITAVQKNHNISLKLSNKFCFWISLRPGVCHTVTG